VAQAPLGPDGSAWSFDHPPTYRWPSGIARCLHSTVEAAQIPVRQIVAFVAGGLMVMAGGYSIARGLAGIAPVHVVVLVVMALGAGFVVAGVVQWHRKVYR